MNREIVFRGRDHEGTWHYGDVRINSNNNARIFMKIDGSSSGTPVIRKTVGQWTGLHDKDKKMIFEGDLVNTKYSNINYIVSFVGLGFDFVNETTGSHLAVDFGDLNIVGTIHD